VTSTCSKQNERGNKTRLKVGTDKTGVSGDVILCNCRHETPNIEVIFQNRAPKTM